MRFLLLCGFVLVACATLEASSLFGRVIEVNSGDVITVFNLNRPVRVKLLGVDAPEMDQPFGDVAKKHLSDLIYDKSVLVEYSGISGDGSLAARVLLNSADIGAQMIRDGAAWSDPNSLSRLSPTDREVYQQSEQAARSERRGLWQAENPTAPWEFAKAESLRTNPAATLNSMQPTPRTRADRPVPELTNLTLLMGGMNASGPRQTNRSDISAAWASLTATPKEWHEIRPLGQSFSALVPEEGRQLAYPVPFGDQVVDVNMYIGRDGSGLYAVLWVTGPTYGEPDKLAIDAIVLNSFIKGAHESYEKGDRSPFSCRRQHEKDVSMNGYKGIEFDLSSCSLPTRVRAFTRVVGDQRQMYVGAVFYGDEDENVARFVESFTVGPVVKPRTR